MKIHSGVFIILAFLLAGCASPAVIPTATTSATPTFTPLPAYTTTFTPTWTPSPTLEPSLTLLFYGDSVLKVGEVGREGSVGFSFVDVLRTKISPIHEIVMANYGGRKAIWGYNNLEQKVLSHEPNVVTLWWGMNDLGGCPGIFDRTTNQLLGYRLTAYINESIQAMHAQTDMLLELDIPVFILTPIPVLGDLPWSHIDSDNQLVWEEDYRCQYNKGLEILAETQRQMISEYAAQTQPVYLVDAWQVYQEHPDTGKMYMDIIHTGSNGARLIAEEWLRVFNQSRGNP